MGTSRLAKPWRFFSRPIGRHGCVSSGLCVAPNGHPRLAVSPRCAGRGLSAVAFCACEASAGSMKVLALVRKGSGGGYSSQDRGQCRSRVTGMSMRPASSTELRWSAYGFAQSDVSQPVLWLSAQAHCGVVWGVGPDSAGVQEWFETAFAAGSQAFSASQRAESFGRWMGGLGGPQWFDLRCRWQRNDAAAVDGVLGCDAVRRGAGSR